MLEWNIYKGASMLLIFLLDHNSLCFLYLTFDIRWDCCRSRRSTTRRLKLCG